jgi:hypothetical protein
MDSQVRIQNEINPHNQGKKWLMQVECKWCDKFSKNNLKQKLYTTRNL